MLVDHTATGNALAQHVLDGLGLALDTLARAHHDQAIYLAQVDNLWLPVWITLNIKIGMVKDEHISIELHQCSGAIVGIRGAQARFQDLYHELASLNVAMRNKLFDVGNTLRGIHRLLLPRVVRPLARPIRINASLRHQSDGQIGQTNIMTNLHAAVQRPKSGRGIVATLGPPRDQPPRSRAKAAVLAIHDSAGQHRDFGDAPY